jgi:hypothetical protein
MTYAVESLSAVCKHLDKDKFELNKVQKIKQNIKEVWQLLPTFLKQAQCSI